MKVDLTEFSGYPLPKPGSVHTSSATVSVLPEADEIDIRIEESDLQVDVFRSSDQWAIGKYNGLSCPNNS